MLLLQPGPLLQHEAHVQGPGFRPDPDSTVCQERREERREQAGVKEELGGTAPLQLSVRQAVAKGCQRFGVGWCQAGGPSDP